MNHELQNSPWSLQHDQRSTEAEKKLSDELFCTKTCALISYISENLLAADIKWSLFCAACNSYRFDSALKPFPPFFIHQDDKQIEKLRELIELCPSMSNILKQLRSNTLPPLLKDLLHWVLIHLNEPSFKYIPKEEHQDILTKVSSKMPATVPDFIFSVTHNSRHQQKFASNAINHSTKFAFHGSRLDNFYSIVNYGLQVSFHKESAFGPGIYLSKEMIVSLSYSPRGFTWGLSLLGSHISLVALCEVIDHPSVRSENDSNENSLFDSCNNHSLPGKYLIVGNSDLVCLRYLLVYSSENSESISVTQSPTLIGWIKRHKMFTFVIGYVIFLLGLGSSNSSVLFKYYRKLLRRFDNTESQW